MGSTSIRKGGAYSPRDFVSDLFCVRHSLKFRPVGVAGSGSTTDAELGKHTSGGTV